MLSVSIIYEENVETCAQKTQKIQGVLYTAVHSTFFGSDLELAVRCCVRYIRAHAHQS